MPCCPSTISRAIESPNPEPPHIGLATPEPVGGPIPVVRVQPWPVVAHDQVHPVRSLPRGDGDDRPVPGVPDGVVERDVEQLGDVVVVERDHRLGVRLR